MTSNEVIDLTASSPPTQPKPSTRKAASVTPGDTSSSDKAKQSLSRKKRKIKAWNVVDGTSEHSDTPRASVEPPQPHTESKEATQPPVLQGEPPSKRKRGHADRSEPAASPTQAASEDRDRPGPLKRHNSDQDDGFSQAPTSPAPVTPTVNASATSETAKPQKNKRNRGSKVRRLKESKKVNAEDQEEGELTEIEVNNPPTINASSSTNDRKRKRSESPSRLAPKVNGKRQKSKSKSASGKKTTSDIESVKSPTSHMFFVDLDPTKDVVYESPEVQSKYRMEEGNLLLPQNVLLETAEEQQFSLSAAEVPPTDDTDSDTEEGFQLIEDINGVCFTFLNVDLLLRIFPVSTILWPAKATSSGTV